VFRHQETAMHTTFPATNPKTVKRIPLLCGVAALLLSGCGDDAKSQDGDVKTTTSSTVTTTTTAPTTTTTAPTATSGTTAAAAKITVPNVVGKDLQLAQDTMQAAGLGTSAPTTPPGRVDSRYSTGTGWSRTRHQPRAAGSPKTS
jgi:hypothetical protein